MNKDELTKQFEDCARTHGKFMVSDSKKANRAYDELMNVAREIRSLPEQGVDVLKGLTSSENDNVAMAAAVALLPIEEKFAKSVLKRIQRGGGILGFNAEMTLEEWKAGRLKID